MGKMALGIFAAALLLGGHSAGVAQAAGPQAPANPPLGASSAVPNKIIGYTAWDEEYLYVAVQVTKPVAAGTNSAPFSNPLEDDAILISLQMDNDHKATARTARSVTVAVSAAGGTQIYAGEKSAPLYNGFMDLNQKLEAISKTTTDQQAQEKARIALLGTVPKVTVSPVGGTRPGAGDYPGYTFEVAIPWVDLGGKPDGEARIGFNVAAISKSPGSPKVLSLSPSVHGNSDLDNPSLYVELLLASAPKGSTSVLFNSPRVIANKPTIDGQFAPNEWNRLSGFEFGEAARVASSSAAIAATIAARTRAEFAATPARPAIEIIPTPAFAAAPLAHTPGKIEQLVLARYDYDYQADPRKAVPTERVTNADHSSALAHHPLDGPGPWFSFERADWHRTELSEARKSGIDVILPVYRADAGHRKQYADRGLMILAEALQGMQRAGQDCPQVGMFLDTTSLVQSLGDKVNLADAAAQNTLYSAIRDFYIEIPPQFRSSVALSTAEKATAGYPVFLSDGSAFKAVDAAGLQAVRNRFKQEFDGADLVFVGVNGFANGAGLDSVVAGGGTGGWFKTGRVNPGYDIGLARLFAPTVTGLTSRKGGDAYRNEWTSAISAKSDWVLLDTWNDFSLGGELAPSIEEGFGSSDQTRIFSRMFNGTDKVKVKFLGSSVPSTIAAHSTITVPVRIQNAGTEGWPTGANIGLTYRWLKGGSVVASETTAIPAGTVASGATTMVDLKISTTVKGTELAEGYYVLEIAAAQRGASTDLKTLQIPVTVAAGAKAERPTLTVLNTDLPHTFETGSVYTVKALLRNDTGVVWKAGDRVGLRFVQHGGGALNAATILASADSSTALTKDLGPGEEAAISLTLPVVDATGKPLTVAEGDAPSMLAVRFEVAHATGAGAVSNPIPVQLTSFDFGVRFTQDDTPTRLPGERKQPVNLGLRNDGPQTWKKESVRVGYHWYYQDGTEFLWEDESTALPNDVPPGGAVDKLLAWITPPPCDGTYYLVWDVKFGDTWASTSAATRVFDQQVHTVQVIGGRLTFIDLTKQYNTAGVTDISNPSAANFDGKGWSFPAATIPPYTDDGIVPSGIWQSYDKTGPESPRRISFKWGPKEGKSFITCHGQRVDFKANGAKCRVLHVVAAATGASPNTNIKLVFQEPSSESEDLYAFSVSRYDQPPTNSEAVVYSSTYHHTPDGPKDGTVSLYHYQFVIRDPRKLIALKLPNDPSIKIAAVTLER